MWETATITALNVRARTFTAQLNDGLVVSGTFRYHKTDAAPYAAFFSCVYGNFSLFATKLPADLHVGSVVDLSELRGGKGYGIDPSNA